MLTSVVISYLEMTDPGDLKPKLLPRTGLKVVRAARPLPELNRFFYSAIGGDWFWIDRLNWTYAQWLNYLDRDALQTWIITVDGVPAGFFELELQAEGNVEIVYFGLLAAFVEQGLGGWALTQAVERAWAVNAARVWVHTCTLDHPRALANYLARGFRRFKEETKFEDLPAAAPGPWPGANKGR